MLKLKNLTKHSMPESWKFVDVKWIKNKTLVTCQRPHGVLKGLDGKPVIEEKTGKEQPGLQQLDGVFNLINERVRT